MTPSTEWVIRIFFFGDTAELNHVLHEQVETAYAKISERYGRGCRAAVPAMIVSVDCQTGGIQKFDRLAVTADVFTHAMSNLDHAARWTMTIPTKASHSQSVRARKVELGGRSVCGICDLSRHRVLLHLPWNCAARFSRNARVPSRLSSVAAQSPKNDASSARPSAWLVSIPLFTASSEYLMATGALAKISRRSASARGISSVAGTTSFTSPIR